MKFNKDFVVVKMECLFNEEVKFNGPEGQKLMIMTAQNPEHHVRNYGTVVSVPTKLSKRVFAMNAIGPPLYNNMSPNELIWLNQVPITVQKGDKVYMHHQAIMQTLKDETLILKEKRREDGGHTYWLKVLYSMIFCSVRDEEVIPNATWTLVRPDMETWDDIKHPVPELDDKGQPKFKTVSRMNQTTMMMENVKEPVLLPEDQWIIVKTRPESKLLLGFIEHVGENLIGEPNDLKKGDHIVYRQHADFRVNIDGQEYFLIKQRHIEGKVEEVVEN